MNRHGSGLRARGPRREGHGPAESAINRDILAVLTPGARGYRALLALCLALYLSGLVVFAYQTRMGLGVTGLQPPVFWGAYIVTFVFSIIFMPSVGIADDIGPLRFFTENYAPFNFEKNGKLQGISTRLLIKMFRQANSSKTLDDINVVP